MLLLLRLLPVQRLFSLVKLLDLVLDLVLESFDFLFEGFDFRQMVALLGWFATVPQRLNLLLVALDCLAQFGVGGLQIGVGAG